MGADQVVVERLSMGELPECPDAIVDEAENAEMAAEMDEIFDVEKRPSCINKEEEEKFIEEVKAKARAAGVRLSLDSESPKDKGSSKVVPIAVGILFLCAIAVAAMYFMEMGPFADIGAAGGENDPQEARRRLVQTSSRLLEILSNL